jgi:hypothetical protein
MSCELSGQRGFVQAWVTSLGDAGHSKVREMELRRCAGGPASQVGNAGESATLSFMKTLTREEICANRITIASDCTRLWATDLLKNLSEQFGE